MPRKSMESTSCSIDLRGIFHLLSDCVSEYVLYNDEIAAGMHEEDNPVIMVAKYKR